MLQSCLALVGSLRQTWVVSLAPPSISNIIALVSFLTCWVFSVFIVFPCCGSHIYSKCIYMLWATRLH